MGLKRKLGFVGLTVGSMYVGSVLTQYFINRDRYAVAKEIIASKNSSSELREAAEKYADRLEDVVSSARILKPFQIVERPPYEPVYQLIEN